MPFPWLAIGAGAVAAGLSKIGADDQNEANAEQARLNREFQREMSNTQYQRGVADIRAAGLNPALAYQQGGASSPTGSSAPPMQNALQGAANSASTLLQLQQTAAQTENIRMDTEKKATEINATQQTLAYELPNILARTNLAIEQTRSLTEQNKQQLKFLEQELRAAILRNDETEVRIAASKLRNRLDALGIPEAQASHDYYQGLGRYSPYLGGAKQILDMIPGSLLNRFLGPGNVNAPKGKTIINNYRR